MQSTFWTKSQKSNLKLKGCRMERTLNVLLQATHSHFLPRSTLTKSYLFSKSYSSEDRRMDPAKQMKSTTSLWPAACPTWSYFARSSAASFKRSSWRTASMVSSKGSLRSQLRRGCQKMIGWFASIRHHTKQDWKWHAEWDVLSIVTYQYRTICLTNTWIQTTTSTPCRWPSTNTMVKSVRYQWKNASKSVNTR